MRPKTVFCCSECGYESPKWMGKCPQCGTWNSFAEFTPVEQPTGKHGFTQQQSRSRPVLRKSIWMMSRGFQLVLRN